MDELWEIAGKGDLEEIRKYIREKKVDENTLNDGLREATNSAHLQIVKELLVNNALIQGSLSIASSRCYISIMRELIALGANVNEKGYENKAPLHTVCSHSSRSVSTKVQAEAIKLLIANGADPSIKDKYGKTPFQHANDETIKIALTQAIEENKEGKLEAYKVNQNVNYLETIKHEKQLWQYASDGDLEGVKKRIDEKGKLVINNEIDERNQNTALMYACWRNHLSIVQFLLDNGANVHAKDIHGETALIQASVCGYLPIIQELLKYGANVNDKSKESETSLIYAAKYGYLDVVKTLIGKGANVNGENMGKFSPLKYALTQNNFGMMKVLIENGANINETGNEGNSCLQLASKHGDLEIVKMLITKDANINDKDKYGNSSLMFASECGHVNILKVFIKSGANINDKNNEGNNSLMFAAKHGHVEVVKVLIDSGTNVNAKNKFGQTALMMCSGEGKYETIKELIESGANINDADNNGKTAIFYSKNCVILRELLKKGANINHRNKYGNTIVHYTCESYFNNMENIRILIAHGADTTIRNNEGETAFEVIHDKSTRDGYNEAIDDQKNGFLFPFDFNENSISRLFKLIKVYLIDEPVAKYLDLIEQELSSSSCPVEELILNQMKLNDNQLFRIVHSIANNPDSSIHTLKLQKLQSNSAESILTDQVISTIYKIKSLRTLDISHNKYNRLPIEVDKIPSHLKIIICQGSELPSTIPDSIIDQGDEALFGYLSSSSTQFPLVGSNYDETTTFAYNCTIL